MTPKTAAHLVAEAKTRVPGLTPEEAAAELRRGDVLFVDIRETEERLANGAIRGTVHAPRGMLEFCADPTSAHYRGEFDPARRTILCCASGGRGALAAAALMALGYADVAYLQGGLRAWRASGFAVETTG